MILNVNPKPSRELESYQTARTRLCLAIGGLLLAASILALPAFLKHTQWSDVSRSLMQTFSNKYTLMLSVILTASFISTYGIYRFLRNREKKEGEKLYTVDGKNYTFKDIYQCHKSEMVGSSIGTALLISAVIALTISNICSPAFRELINGNDLLKLPVIILAATSFVFTIIKSRDVYIKSKLIK